MTVDIKQARATKKQKELLSFIDGFIKGNGYGPSYREIMRALDYKSVSTVATHVSGLITKGYLKKDDASARSLSVVQRAPSQPTKEQWLAGELAKKRHQPSLLPDVASRHSIEAIDHVAKLLNITL